MIASIPWIQSALNLFMSGILICQGFPQIFELFHPFEGTTINLYIVILSCVLLSKHYNLLSFISIYLYSDLLNSDRYIFRGFL